MKIQDLKLLVDAFYDSEFHVVNNPGTDVQPGFDSARRRLIESGLVESHSDHPDRVRMKISGNLMVERFLKEELE